MIAEVAHACTWWRNVEKPWLGWDVTLESVELARWFADPWPHRGAKGDLPAWSPARFRGGRRSLANVLGVSMLVLDVDEPQTSPASFFSRVADALPAVAFFGHSSFSSAIDAFKFRVVVLLDTVVDVNAYALLWARVARMLERATIAVDAQCKDASRLFFVPAVPPSGAYAWHAQPGSPFPAAMATELERAAREREEHERQKEREAARQAVRPRRRGAIDVAERARRYVANMPAAISGSGGHAATYKVAAVLARGFLLEESIAWDILAGDYNPRCEPAWSEADLRRKLDQATRADRVRDGWLLEARRR